MTRPSSGAASAAHPDAAAHIAAVETAVPEYTATQEQARDFLINHYGSRLSPRSRSIVHKLFSHPGIRKRHFAFDAPDCLINEDPDQRIRRFTNKAVELSSRAIMHALSRAGISPAEVNGLIVNTCTGYICPGISTYLIELLNLPRTVQAYDLVGSGCGGALPNLRVAESLLKGEASGVVVSASVEICSATFQMEDDLSLIVSNALFADGAAAAVLWNRPEGFELVASASYYVPEHRDDIRYVHRNGQLFNQISSTLSHAVKKAAARVVDDLLKPRGLSIGNIRHWALHNGGEKIIAAIKSEIGLSEEQLRATRAILAGYGNMSSPTVWFVLRNIIENGIEPGEWCVMLAFGAGLSAHGYLLRKK
ncbi:MAG: type III polyketide synthase [Nitrospirota bacterium]